MLFCYAQDVHLCMLLPAACLGSRSLLFGAAVQPQQQQQQRCEQGVIVAV